MLLFLVMVKLSNICPGYRGFEPLSRQTKDYKGERAKICRLGIRIMCPSGVETLLNWRYPTITHSL